MSKPRLSTGRIPFTLGISADAVTDLPYQGDAYYYDTSGATGSVTGGTVQPGPIQDSPIGSISGGTVLPPETII